MLNEIKTASAVQEFSRALFQFALRHVRIRYIPNLFVSKASWADLLRLQLGIEVFKTENSRSTESTEFNFEQNREKQILVWSEIITGEV